MFGLLGLGAGSTFSASFVDCAVPCLQRPDTETTEQTNGELRRDVRRSRTESHLESPPKTAYRFLGMAPPWTQTSRENATHPKPTVLSDFILGSQDGIVNVLGLILGLSAATRDVRIILVATLAALGAESIAMGAVAYTSTRARRRLYLSQALQERREMKEIPQTERDEVREILRGWGYRDADLEEIVERICRNPTAELEFMMSFELKLSPVEAGAPRASAFLVGTATVVGHFIPLSPFFFVGSDVLRGAVLAVLLSAVALFGIGWYEAKITVGSWWREGLEMLVIGLGGGVAGYVIGRLVGAA